MSSKGLSSPRLALIANRAHSERDLREAVAVSARNDGQQIEIQLGHLCNNVCAFCVSGQLTQQGLAKRIDLQPVVSVLEEARTQGVQRVTFLGGEPTIQRSFLPALEKAVELGFQDIVIFTNLVRGREPRFLERVTSMGSFTWRVSIQGGNEEAHDAVVGRAGAFAKIIQGLKWLREHGQDMTANSCINEESYRSAPDYVDLVQSTGLRQLHLDMVRPGSTGVRSEEHMENLLARYTDIAGPLGAMLDGFDAWNPDFEVNIGNLPFCVLPRHAHRIVHGGEETLTVTTDDEGELGRIWDKYSYQGADKVLAPTCAECVFRPHCRGVPAGYAEMYGVSELSAVSAEEQAQLDPRVGRWLRTGWRPGREAPASEQRSLARVVKLARRLRQSGPYAGWAVTSVESTSSRSASVTLSRDDEHIAVQIQAHPGQRPPVKVSFDLPEGVAESTLRDPVDAVARVLRG